MNTKEKAIKALRRLVRASDLDAEDLEDAVAEGQKVIDAYDKEARDKIEGYPYLPVDKIPGYRR